MLVRDIPNGMEEFLNIHSESTGFPPMLRSERCQPSPAFGHNFAGTDAQRL